jgi:hypothetical protein
LKRFRIEIEDSNDAMKSQMNQIIFSRIPDMERQIDEATNHLKSPFLMQVAGNIDKLLLQSDKVDPMEA